MPLKREQELELWKEYNTTGDSKKLNQLLESFDPLIQREVNVFKAAPVPTEAVKIHAQVLAKKAFDTYDPTRSQLNTHLVNSLKKLNRFIYENQNIAKIPEHRILRITQYKSVVDQLRESLLREPSSMEISNEMHIPLAEVQRLESELRQDLELRNETADEEGGGFFLDPQQFTDKTLEAIHFVYYSVPDQATKSLMELYFGLFGKTKCSVLSAAQQTGIPYAKANKLLRELADQIKDTEKNLS